MFSFIHIKMQYYLKFPLIYPFFPFSSDLIPKIWCKLLFAPYNILWKTIKDFWSRNVSCLFNLYTVFHETEHLSTFSCHKSLTTTDLMGESTSVFVIQEEWITKHYNWELLYAPDIICVASESFVFLKAIGVAATKCTH